MYAVAIKMNKYFYIILFVLFLTGLIYVYKNHQGRVNAPTETTPQTQKYIDIASGELYEMLKSKDFYFVNVHTPYEGEIEKTDAFIPYNEIDRNLNNLPNDKNAKIVLYCRSGRMSTIAAQKLVDLG